MPEGAAANRFRGKVLRVATNNEGGAVIVEFGVIFPIMALLIAATVAFGSMFTIQNSLHHAAREGVRVAAITGDAGDAAATVLSRTPATVRGDVDTVIVTCDPDQPGMGDASVALSYMWQGFSPIAEVIGDVPLQATAVMRCGA